MHKVAQMDATGRAFSFADREYRMRMKRVLCVALAVSLLGTTAASAEGWHHGGHFGHHGFGTGLGIGLGILTLGIIASESPRHYYRDHGYYRVYREGYAKH